MTHDVDRCIACKGKQGGFTCARCGQWTAHQLTELRLVSCPDSKEMAAHPDSQKTIMLRSVCLLCAYAIDLDRLDYHVDEEQARRRMEERKNG